MTQSDPFAFLNTERELANKRQAEDRCQDFSDIYSKSAQQKLSEQAERCLDCGNPYCQWKCPLHNHIPNWLNLVADGKLQQAAQTMLNTNPLPEICGRVCPQDRLCEQACTLNTGFGAVTIGSIEKQISDLAIENDWYVSTTAPATGWSVAVVGSGPAGIGCAEYLARQGVKVTVYEKNPEIGGLLTFGIPGFKLEKSVLTKRRKFLESLGIEFITNTEIGKDIEFETIRSSNNAVFLGLGAYQGVDGGLINADNENNPNIIPALEYLIGVTDENHNFKMKDAVFHDLKDKQVLVFGGGDTAMDCVRTAVRQSAKSVDCVYRRTELEMPGSKREVQSAKEEGVNFQFHLQPTAIVKDGDGLKVEASHRESGETVNLSADVAIIAFGFKPNPPGWLVDIETESDGRVMTQSTSAATELSQATSIENVYVGGDMSRGADLVVTAIADGRDAAQQILMDLFSRKNA